MNRAFKEMESIFLSAVERVSPYKMIMNHLCIKNHILKVNLEDIKHEVNLDDFKRIFILGAGKATASMALAIEEILEDKITAGIISVKYGHTEVLNRVEIIEAGHPIPDENSIASSRELMRMARQADAETLVINLISGGGSALLSAPYQCETPDGILSITMEEKQSTTRALLACGADIGEINCLRKHISLIKGGRLASLLYPAVSLNLILSDVVGDRLDSIASGLTVPDSSTFKDADRIIKKYSLEEKLPPNVLDLIHRGLAGKVEETPKPGDRVFTKVFNILLGTNYTGLLAAGEKAESLGYNTVLLSSRITGEAKEIAKVYVGIARDVSRYECLVKKPACIIGGGETTVTLQGKGTGGRNQECSLSFLEEMQGDWDENEKIYFLSASTDGNDGPTDAAGAFVSRELLIKSRKLGLSMADFLKRNDSYHFFESLGALLKTGPTNTNVCDYQICLVL